MMQNNFLQGKKYVWRLPQVMQDDVQRIAIQHTLALPLACVLAHRGMTQADEIHNFLYTTDAVVGDSATMKGAQQAIDRILQAIQTQEKILIFGDYDVDGITSSSLMMMGLLEAGANVNFYLPNRVKDGYGLSTKIVQRASKNAYSLIITVDNGITAFEAVQKAKELGIDVIITDHHQPHDHVPDAFVIVNPHQQDCQYPFKYFAGVGVAFKLLELLYKKLEKPIPHKVIELLLLGTVADVVPLTGENRYWVRYGLQLLNEQESVSFRVLKENGNVFKPAITSTDVGFSITPQINALGRLDDPRQGVQFLLDTNEQEVRRIGKVLLELNQARKDIEADIFKEVVHLIESKKIDLEKENVILAGSKNWPAGVIGLVASRLVSAYGKPTLLFHLTDDGLAKGSCRSIAEFNMFDALCVSKDLLIAFGGHDVAAGLSLNIDNLPLLKQNIEQRVLELLTPFDLQQKLQVDAHAQLADFTPQFMSQMAYFEPFGSKNSAPVFMIKDVVLVQKPKLLKEAHVKCVLFADGVIKHAIFFKRPELYHELVAQADKPFSIVAQVMQNYWDGKYTIELQGIDVAF
jgi:single-stranded-DNA-specific exonuclease